MVSYLRLVFQQSSQRSWQESLWPLISTWPKQGIVKMRGLRRLCRANKVLKARTDRQKPINIQISIDNMLLSML